MAEAPAPRGFDDWACQNRDDRIREVSALRVAMGDARVRLVEQAGGGNYYGLIEIIMDNMIATGNSRGTAHKEFFVRVDDVTGVNVFEKYNHGVVDLEFLGEEGAVMPRARSRTGPTTASTSCGRTPAWASRACACANRTTTASSTSNSSVSGVEFDTHGRVEYIT